MMPLDENRTMMSTLNSIRIEELKFCKVAQLFCVSVSLVKENLRGLRRNLNHKNRASEPRKFTDLISHTHTAMQRAKNNIQQASYITA